MDHRSFFQQLSEEPEEPEEYCVGTSGHNVYRDTRHIVCDECGRDMGTEGNLRAEGYGVGRIPMHRVSN
jgi:hypothetical protein